MSEPFESTRRPLSLTTQESAHLRMTELSERVSIRLENVGCNGSTGFAIKDLIDHLLTMLVIDRDRFLPSLLPSALCLVRTQEAKGLHLIRVELVSVVLLEPLKEPRQLSVLQNARH